jgi:hypothetical protein
MSNGLVYRCPLPASLNGDSCGEANEHPEGPYRAVSQPAIAAIATARIQASRSYSGSGTLTSKWA